MLFLVQYLLLWWCEKRICTYCVEQLQFSSASLSSHFWYEFHEHQKSIHANTHQLICIFNTHIYEYHKIVNFFSSFNRHYDFPFVIPFSRLVFSLIYSQFTSFEFPKSNIEKNWKVATHWFYINLFALQFCSYFSFQTSSFLWSCICFDLLVYCSLRSCITFPYTYLKTFFPSIQQNIYFHL